MIASMAALLAGGAAGVFLRWAFSVAALSALGGWLPWGTLIVNLTGCLLIGFFDALVSKRGLGGPHGRMLLLTGFCGGYTTFSSLILELDSLLRAAPLRGGGYLLVSVAAGLALFRAGAFLGGH